MAEVIPGPWAQHPSFSSDLPTEPRVSPSRHLRIPNLVPWREQPYRMTLCGKTKGNLTLVEEFDDTTCLACRDKFGSLRMILNSPVTRLKEAIRRETDPRTLSAEMWAVTALANRYREEFDTLTALRLSVYEQQEKAELGQYSEFHPNTGEPV